MPELNALGQPVGPVLHGWERRPTPEPITLEGRYARLVPLNSVHYADLFASVCGPQDDPVWTYRTIAKPRSLAALWMHLADVVDTPQTLTFALVPLEEAPAGKAHGIASFQRIDPATGQVEVGGVLFSAALQRTRAATEAIHLLMRHAFEDLGYRRCEWKCDSLNAPSRRAAARLGFTYEGTFRNHMVVQDRSRDTDWFSVTDSEWPRVRDAHEAWLDPGNFDDAGVQKDRLWRRSSLGEAPASSQASTEHTRAGALPSGSARGSQARRTS